MPRIPLTDKQKLALNLSSPAAFEIDLGERLSENETLIDQNEAAIRNLAGEGRTTETVESVAAQVASLANHVMGSNKNISCIGDSMTLGSGGGGTNYPTVLANNDSNLTVYNMGHSGKDAEYVANAIGACNIYVQPTTIPSTTTPVQITVKNSTNSDIILNQLSVAINPVSIDGIEGIVSYADNIMYFTRTVAGTEKVLIRPTKLITNFVKKHLNDICIFWVGTNNEPIVNATDTVILLIKDMIELLPHKKYLVLPVITLSKFSNIINITVYFKRAFGDHFINIRQYLLDYGLADAGITPTVQDNTDIAAGEIPTSLRSDDTHLNAAGYTVLGNYLYKVLVEMGYI